MLALSTNEAKFIASLSASRELLWLRRLLTELNLANPAIITYCNSQGAITLIKSGTITARTKHIDIPYLFMHELVTAGIVDLQYCPTNCMIADALTKALPREKVQYFAQLMGLCHTA
jgi:hypothetical protein